MKRTIFISVFALIGTIAYSQSYDDFFTTYKDVSTQTKQKQQSYGGIMVAIMVVTIIMVLPNMM